ncbi:20S cyclosome subunit [Grosmannia clavigera kw1407]|uniref:20S cyclosome subunit n=1 Tax=Grosmannia clavigera (strain kw1407 / UAMH 11150) TaxID=655863 RepID=F0XG48_GROCL|nr:20S cyclosome subunit [Grosmannia clavigera kw1407]EFX03396.1 20S cyclosome subunit [Grosmannia clavigera kw1407]
MASVKSTGIHEPAGLRFAIAENILPYNAAPDSYAWEIHTDDNGEDELFTTDTCAIWSRGGEVGRCLRFEAEKEPILKALLAYFPAGENGIENEDSASCNTGADPSTRSSLSKTLIVFLKTQAHVFSFSGGEYVIHMPFEVETAIAAPRGVIIQRKSKLDTTVPVTLKFPRAPPNSFLSSHILPMVNDLGSQTFSTASLGKPRPMPLRLSSTLDTMWDTPLETGDSGWPRLVFLADPMLPIGLVALQPEKGSRLGISARTPFLDPAEEILHVESIMHDRTTSNNNGNNDSLVLAVTVNRETSMYSVWRMSYLNSGDQITSRRKKPKTTVSRRRSSMQPGLQSGTTTPRHSSMRESLGGTLPVKKTRRGEAPDKGDTSLEMALSLETDRAAEASRRQSRRVSSLLARADLSASQERPLFAETPLLSTGTGRRADSHGSQRGRASVGLAATTSNVLYNQTLNSLLEAPVDGLLEELRSGGDFEGFHSMRLDDTEYDGLSKEILFTKIRSVPMDTANLRYSLSNTPANKLSKVYIVTGTPYSVDEQDRNYLLICIQDMIDTRLQLLTLHIQTRRSPMPLADKETTSITWGQLRRAQNVADSCKIFDGDQTMILILSEGNDGQHQLSIQAPWSELTTIVLPSLSLYKQDVYSTYDFEEPFPNPQPDVVEAMHICGFTAGMLDSLPEGIAAPLRDAVSRCQQHPPPHWDHGLYELVGRGDINTVLKAGPHSIHTSPNRAIAPAVAHHNSQAIKGVKDETNIQPVEEPESEERQAVIQALFGEDKRLYEAQGLLSACIMGIGLLYYNSQHRRMSEIMMSEIEFMDDEDEEDPLRNEGYRLAAGFALGFINLGKGSDRKGLLDMQITEQLLSLAYSTKKVELVNVLDRSAAAATVAICLIYMKTEDQIVARKIDVPDSILQFDYVRPDVLLLRTLAKNLILWSGIALRYAGSANRRVRDMLVHYLDSFRRIVQELPADHFDAQTARAGARMCLDVLALSCATVMSGTGDLIVLRRLRSLHGRDDVHTTYGSHFAAHLAIGTLFLGSGTTTFGNSNLAVAALLVAFYPIFPTTIQDNGSHLQAFRHFWVLATEPRCLVTKDIATGLPISVPITICLKPTALSISALAVSREEYMLHRKTPCLLPPLEDVITVRTDASAQGYWDLEVNFERHPNLRHDFQTNQNLYLRRRPAHECAFSTTLQVLGCGVPATLIAPSIGLPSTGLNGESACLDWLFELRRFKGITLAERAYMLGQLGTSEDGNGHIFSNIIDARLVLETSLERWSRNGLLDLRLLFDWASLRDSLRQCDEGAGSAVENRDKGTEMEVPADLQHEGQLPWSTSSAAVDWWMDDSIIDTLKGKAWIAGQKERIAKPL